MASGATIALATISAAMIYALGGGLLLSSAAAAARLRWRASRVLLRRSKTTRTALPPKTNRRVLIEWRVAPLVIRRPPLVGRR